MYRSSSLESKELMVLYGGQRDHYFVRDEDCTSEDYDLDSEEEKGGRGIHSSVSQEMIYRMQKGQHVYFSNQEYYRRLEELKITHLRNMAELERMYISQGRGWQREEDEEENGDPVRVGDREAREQSISSCPSRKLQRINSQEELDFHDTSSGSDQSDVCGEESTGELDLDCRRRAPCLDKIFGRDNLLNLQEQTIQKQFQFQPKATCPKSQRRSSHQPGVRVRSSSKVTVPKPFNMMLREEERKKHKVRTRSEIELENMLLRRELEELRECQKQFRASPAPAHIHLPLNEIISRRSGQRSNQHRGSSDICNNKSKNNQALAAASPQPFHFLERERRKKEAKIVAELGDLGQKEERQAFKARPMPSSVYGTRHRAHPRTTNHQPLSLSICTQEREATEGHSDPNSDLEPETLESKSDTSANDCRPQRCLPAKSAKKQIELSIEMVREGEWSCAGPPRASAV